MLPITGVALRGVTGDIPRLRGLGGYPPPAGVSKGLQPLPPYISLSYLIYSWHLASTELLSFFRSILIIQTDQRQHDTEKNEKMRKFHGQEKNKTKQKREEKRREEKKNIINRYVYLFIYCFYVVFMLFLYVLCSICSMCSMCSMYFVRAVG